MQNPRLAGRYAKSLVDLSSEKGLLDTVYSDMKYLQAINKSSREFVNLLRSPIIHKDKKNAIIAAVVTGKIAELTAAFLKLIVTKNREANLPEIVEAFIDQYNDIKGIHKVRLTTASPVSDELKQAIVNKVKAEVGLANIELEAKVNEDLIGGFTLEFHNSLVDASALRELKEIRKQFQDDEYIQNIR